VLPLARTACLLAVPLHQGNGVYLKLPRGDKAPP
jgi:hypothetical protein